MTDHATRAREKMMNELVNKFLSWPLPDSVCSDLCATQRGAPHRSGTTLLTATEARQMIEYLFAAALDQAAQEAVTELGDLRLRLNCPMVAPSCLVCGQQKELVIRHLEASAIGVCGDCRNAAQAAQPVWTKEKPTKEGWYWWRSGDIVGIHVLEFDGDEGGELVCMTTDGDTIEEMGGEWAGPLPEPREATCQK